MEMILWLLLGAVAVAPTAHLMMTTKETETSAALPQQAWEDEALYWERILRDLDNLVEQRRGLL